MHPVFKAGEGDKMAKSVSVGYTDTAIAGNPVLTLPRGSLNFAADFKVKTETPSEVVLVNLTSPIDRPEKLRISYNEVANVYNGSDVDPSVYGPSKKGISVLVQLTETLSETDSVDPLYRVDLPISIHAVMKFPANAAVTVAMLQTALGRMVSGFYATGSMTTDRLSSLVRGSLKPSDI